MDLYEQFPKTTLVFNNDFKQLQLAFQQNGLSTMDILFLPDLEIARRCGRSIIEIKEFMLLLREELSTQPQQLSHTTFSEERYSSFTTGDQDLDEYLEGGICISTLTEISGESATGKSHFLMQLCLSVQLPRELNGLGPSLSDEIPVPAQAVFISTEGNLETRRLSDITCHYNEVLLENGIDSKFCPSIDNIFQITCSDILAQDHILNFQLPVLLQQQRKIKLVIIDSIAHHIRVEIEGGNFRQAQIRKLYLSRLAQHMKKLSVEHCVAFVVANQVSDKPDTGLMQKDKFLQVDYQIGWLSGWDNASVLKRQERVEPSDSAKLSFSQQLKQEKKQMLFGDDSGKKTTNSKVPALGLHWSTLVDTRIVLSKRHVPIINETLLDEYVHDIIEGVSQDVNEILPKLQSNSFMQNYNWEVKRAIKLVFSPYKFSSESLEFQIWKGGIRSVRNN